MYARSLSLIALVAFTLPAFGQGAPQPAPLKCDITLFKHIETEAVRREEQLFFLDLVTSENYQDMKRSVNTSWDGPYGFFKGDYSQFETKRENYRKELRIEHYEKYSRDYAVTTLNSEGLEAYKACLLSERPQQVSLILYRDNNASIDTLVTFVVDLKREVALSGPLMVEVYGGGRVISSADQNVRISYSNGVAHIAITNAIGGKQFTVQRKNENIEFRATAEIAGTVATPLTVGPKLETKIDEVPVPVTTQGTFQLLARRLENGSYDFIYTIDGNSGIQINEVFKGNACICASGQRANPTLPFTQAGQCIPPKESQQVRLVVGSVTLQPESLLKEFACGGQVQGPMLMSTHGPQGVCYTTQLSLNAPDQWGTSKTCTVSWTLTGTVMERKAVFVKR